MFIAAVFTIAKCWKQPKCPSVNEWIKNLWHIYTMEHYAAKKKKERKKKGRKGGRKEEEEKKEGKKERRKRKKELYFHISMDGTGEHYAK